MTEELRVVGKSLPRVDAYAKVTGQAKFTVDISLPRMLHGKILRSPHPHARILNVDTTAAERLPGVKAVISGRDTTDMRFAFVDTPRYAADEYPLAQDKVRYIGDEIAAVAAVDLETAQEALDLIKVEYEIINGQKDAISATVAGTDIAPPSAKGQLDIQPDDEHHFWPFDGQYWRDELGYYRFKIVNKCGR